MVRLPSYYVRIKIKGHLSDQWLFLCDGLEQVSLSDGMTLLSGNVLDQAAFMGALRSITDMGLQIIQLSCNKYSSVQQES